MGSNPIEAITNGSRKRNSVTISSYGNAVVIICNNGSSYKIAFRDYTSTYNVYMLSVNMGV